jgi:hypothetical protein
VVASILDGHHDIADTFTDSLVKLTGEEQASDEQKDKKET